MLDQLFFDEKPHRTISTKVLKDIVYIAMLITVIQNMESRYRLFSIFVCIVELISYFSAMLVWLLCSLSIEFIR